MADAPRSSRGHGPQEPSDAPSAIGDERSSRAFQHVPVMRDQIVADLEAVPAGVVLDATLGGAGHAHAILARWDHLTIVGIDRDPSALDAASARLAEFGTRARVARARFDQLDSVLDRLDVPQLAGFLFDLGVSSPQLDWDERGFSFRNDGPLDMRMDPDAPRTAADFVNEADHGEIAAVLKAYGDERFAGRIAEAIVAQRPFTTTTALADVVVAAIPAAARRSGGHPAKRTFQALRIEVNDELNILAPALDAALDRLVPGGRGLVLTYHSGEDRIVKNVFRQRTEEIAPPGLPVAPDPAPFVALRPLARRPEEAEVAANRRAASARLRGVERRHERKNAA